MKLKTLLTAAALLGLAAGCAPAGAVPLPTETAAARATGLPEAAPTPTARPGDPFELISRGAMLANLEDLTAIQAYSGWRSPASSGEAEALDYIAAELQGFAGLNDLGLELERQSFQVYTATELWEERLLLTVGGAEVEVPAEAILGHRDWVSAALRYDSDGQLNDSQRNPVRVSGSAAFALSPGELEALEPGQAEGRVLIAAYALIDPVLQDPAAALENARRLVSLRPAGLVIVTRYSNLPGESHGTYLGDSSVLTYLETGLPRVPTLFFRLEDLAPAGVADWEDLRNVSQVSLIWDADVFSPAESGNLIARIPGTESSLAVIITAGIDSANSPGALDSGSGSAALLEVARVLNETGRQPPVDLYLAWLGAEKPGLWGSGHFAATHQALLDQTVGMLSLDGLSYPLEGIDAAFSLKVWDPGWTDGPSVGQAWADHLARQAAVRGLRVSVETHAGVTSAHNSLAGFGVPAARLTYGNTEQMAAYGGHWAAGHLHEPYDSVELAREMGEELEQMAAIALSAALSPPAEPEALRTLPRADKRALVIASRTEIPHLTPAEQAGFGLALRLAGFDVDLLPYGSAVTPQALRGTDLVIVPPVFDLPSLDGNVTLYDTGWTADEAGLLAGYVYDGGLLVLANSANRLKHDRTAWEPNDDLLDLNDLGAYFGVSFLRETVSGDTAVVTDEHPLVEGISTLRLVEENGVPFTLPEGARVLARSLGGQPLAALVSYGEGEVLVLADAGLLAGRGEMEENLRLWQNLAAYAAGR